MAMDVFERLNRKFGAWYEGLFGGGSDRGDLRPRDILRRILAAMEDNRREGLDGQIYVPNLYTLQIAVADDDERQYLLTFLDADELAAAVKRAIEEHNYRVRGPLVFTIEEMAADAFQSGAGRVRITCRFDTTVAPPPPRPAPVVETPHLSSLDEEDDEPGTVPVAPAAALASLVVRGPDGRLQEVYPLGARGARIGRGRQAGNDIILTGDGMVSKSHARIVYERGQFLLYDENSTNGTMVGGRRMTPGQPYVLQPGDPVRMGETTLLFRPATIGPAAPPAPNDGGAGGPGNALSGSGAPITGGGGGAFRLVAGDGETYALGSEMLVGRTLTCDVVLLANGVASQHARLSTRGDSVYVEDMNTSGGTFVNGERIPAQFPVALYDGDQVGFGEILLRLQRIGAVGRGGGGT